MHEASVAKQLLSVVLEHAGQTDARRITKVSGWVAETEALMPDALQFHFSAHAKDTLAARAVLDLELVHVSAHCNECGFEYKPEHHVTLCPECGSSDGTLLGKTGIGVDSIEVE